MYFFDFHLKANILIWIAKTSLDDALLNLEKPLLDHDINTFSVQTLWDLFEVWTQASRYPYKSKRVGSMEPQPSLDIEESYFSKSNLIFGKK